ncbi:MAG: M23 family metallopeptidase [Bellilinea sp.]
MLKSLSLFVLFALALNGCSPARMVTDAAPTLTPTINPPTHTPTIVLTETPAPARVPTQVPPKVCSPLAGVNLDQLAEMIVNPYHPPKPGSDDPHQGLDLANLSGPGGIALSGMTVQGVMAGKVAGVAKDRFPYGNMLIVETLLDENYLGQLPTLVLPTPLPERLPRGALTCPELDASPAAANEPRSLYILYAHMQNPPIFTPGDDIACGQEIGAIGDSGNALNPHLHIEARVGPAGQIFASMAHYDPSADYGEMAAYCTWRVSGVFQTINPECLWGECGP